MSYVAWKSIDVMFNASRNLTVRNIPDLNLLEDRCRALVILFLSFRFSYPFYRDVLKYRYLFLNASSCPGAA